MTMGVWLGLALLLDVTRAAACTEERSRCEHARRKPQRRKPQRRRPRRSLIAAAAAAAPAPRASRQRRQGQELLHSWPFRACLVGHTDEHRDRCEAARSLADRGPGAVGASERAGQGPGRWTGATHGGAPPRTPRRDARRGGFGTRARDVWQLWILAR